MAAVATGRSIGEVFYALVIASDLGLIAVLMAGDTREHGIVGRVGVAIAAGGPFAVVVAAVDGEVGRVVGGVLGAGPIGETVASIAGLGEAGRRVSGVGGVVIVRLVAAPAIGGGVGIVVGHVA